MRSQRSRQGLNLLCYRRPSRCLLIFVLLALPLSATTYYVDNCVVTGSDSNNGTSTGSPWLTINKVNTSTFNAGDSVLFERTCTWREQLTVPSSGSAGNPITFGAYGSGALPSIDGANLATWTQGTATPPTTVWYTSQAADPHFPIFGNSPGIKQSSVAALTSANQWYWDGSSTLYVYSASNPTNTVEIPTRNYAIYISGKSYVTLDRLEWRGAWSPNAGGLSAQGGSNNITMSNCIMELNYESGAWFYDLTHAQDNGAVSNCVIRNNGGNGFDLNGDMHANWT